MNGKKAKELRRQLREHNAYIDHKTPAEIREQTPQYQAIKTSHMVQTTDPKTDLPTLANIEKQTLISAWKYTYRKAKKAYLRGDIVL